MVIRGSTKDRQIAVKNKISKFAKIGRFRGLTLTVFSIILLGSNQNVGANEIVRLSGNIGLKRNGETEFQSANFLDSLGVRDEVKVGTNSSLIIRCRNTEKPEIDKPGTYLVSNYCPQGEATKLLIDNPTFRPPTENLTQIPYIISPRNSSIFPEPITIKWNRVSEATNYIVTVGEWQIETTATAVVYTGEPLTPGYHSASVKTDNDKFSGNVGFVVIDPAQAQSIREAAAKIKQEGLDKEAEAFILARFYQENKLRLSAIEILEDLVANGSQTKNVYRLLADLYDRVGLESEAYEFSQQAMELGSN